MKLDIFGGRSQGGYSAHGESDIEALAECPFCASDNIEVSNTHTPCYHAECLACGAQGPRIGLAPNEKQHERTRVGVQRQHETKFKGAVKAWNTRKEAEVVF